MTFLMGGWRNGRRGGLKIPCPQGRVGSIPTPPRFSLMNIWFMSTEPDDYPWESLAREGRCRWDGVKGTAAQKFMREMAPGDLVVGYESSPVKAITALARVASGPYLDSTDPEGKRHVIDLVPDRRLSHPIPLAELRAHPILGNMKSVRMPRLSISPVTAAEWKAIRKLGGMV